MKLPWFLGGCTTQACRSRKAPHHEGVGALLRLVRNAANAVSSRRPQGENQRLEDLILTFFPLNR